MNRNHFITAIFFILCVALPSSPTVADVLTIPNASDQTENSVATIDRPTRGMTMDEVREQYGEPREILNPVGNPPITRWIYEKFTVHFERNYVIDSVVHRN